MNKKLKVFLIVITILFTAVLTLNLLYPGIIIQAAEKVKKSTIKVFVNDKESKVAPVKAGKKEYMPLNFPVEEGEQTWEVKMKYDPKTKTLKVHKINKKRKVRSRIKCNLCGGSGDCQACYPAGSGKNIQGNACPACDGTGDCMMCNGDGSY